MKTHKHPKFRELTRVVDTDAGVIVEDVIAEERPSVDDEHALCEHRAEDHHTHDGGREVDCVEGREDDSSVDDTKQDATLQVAVVTIAVEACSAIRESI